MKLDFLICGTPNDAFCSQIAFYKLCLEKLGGDYRNARLVAVFGDHSAESIPSRWEPYFKNIEIVWAHQVGESNPGYRAQHFQRFEIMRPNADMVFICDADTAILRPLDELIAQCKQKPSIFGVIAQHHIPFEQTWQELAYKIIGKSIDIKYRYALLPCDAPNQAPFYINYGFLAGPPNLLHQLYCAELVLDEKVTEHTDSFWAPQICVALAVELMNIPAQAISMRYNYPNDRLADQLYPDEMNNIAIFHYQRRQFFDRHKIFVTEEAFADFINMPLEGSDLVFKNHVLDLTDGFYPFPVKEDECTVAYD